MGVIFCLFLLLPKWGPNHQGQVHIQLYSHQMGDHFIGRTPEFITVRGLSRGYRWCSFSLIHLQYVSESHCPYLQTLPHADHLLRSAVLPLESKSPASLPWFPCSSQNVPLNWIIFLSCLNVYMLTNCTWYQVQSVYHGFMPPWSCPCPPLHPWGIIPHVIHWTGLTLAFFLSLEHSNLILAPGPLHMLFALPGTRFSQITMCLAPSHDTDLWRDASSEKTHPAPLFQIPLHHHPHLNDLLFGYPGLFSLYNYYNSDFFKIQILLCISPQFQCKFLDGKVQSSFLTQYLKICPELRWTNICGMNELSVS